MIPNALLILFCSFHTFCNKFDMFAVRTAYYGIFPDPHSVSDQGALYDSSCFDNHSRHEYTVNDSGAGIDLGTGK